MQIAVLNAKHYIMFYYCLLFLTSQIQMLEAFKNLVYSLFSHFKLKSKFILDFLFTKLSVNSNHIGPFINHVDIPLGVALPFSCQQLCTFHCCELCHCQQCIYQQWYGSTLAMTVWHCQNNISIATKLPNWSLLATM